MKTLIFLLLMLIQLKVGGQNTSVNDIFSSFEGKEGITSLVLSKDLMKLASDAKSDNSELSAFLNNITEIKILVLEKATVSEKDLFHSMIKQLPLNDFKELMTVKDGKQLVKMVIKENGGKITEFLLTVTGEQEPVLISIIGNIDVKQLPALSKKMNINGLGYLTKLEKNKK